MNTLVVYDSQYGNTAKIARQITMTLNEFGSARAVRVNEWTADALQGIDLLIVGSPTQAWNSTVAMKDFFADIDPARLRQLSVAEFDTRFDKPRLITGSAAYAMAKQLKRRGALMLLKPESFLVTGMQGPLADGELERAAEWARALHDHFEVELDAHAVMA